MKYSKGSFYASLYNVDQVGAKIKVTLKTRGGNTFHETLPPTSRSCAQDSNWEMEGGLGFLKSPPSDPFFKLSTDGTVSDTLRAILGKWSPLKAVPTASVGFSVLTLE